MQEALVLENPKAWTGKLKPIVLHGSAFLLLGLSWRFLNEWYLFSETRNYLVFLTLFLIAVALATSQFLWPMIKELPRGRFLTLFVLILLYFPWSEWLQLKPSSSREDWSRQILLQTIYAYAVLLFLYSFRELSEFLSRSVIRALDFIASRKVLLFLPCLLFLLVTSWMAIFFFHRAPLVEDSAAHLFQARIFSKFHLYAPAPVHPEFFSYRGDMLAMKDGRWFSMYPPGLALLLTPAMFVRAEWLVSPLLGALTLGIWILYIVRWHNRRVAGLFGWLFLLSPFFLLMFSTVMVHSPELFIASCLIFLCRRETEEISLWRQVAIFILLTAAILVRAFSILAFLTPVFAYSTLHRMRTKSFGMPVAVIGGGLFGILLLAGFQWKTSGNPLLPGYLIEYPELTNVFALKPEGLEIISNNLHGMSKWLLGWHTGSFLFLLAFFLFERELKTWDRILLFSCVLLIGLYSCYLIQDQLFGPRMFFLLGPFLLLLISRLAVPSDSKHKPAGSAIIILPAILFCAVGALPLRLPALIGKWRPSNYQSGNLQDELNRIHQTRALVFLQKSVSQEFVNWNDPFLQSNTILSRDFGNRNSEIIRKFPGFKPLYFRQNETVEMSRPQIPFIISEEPDYSGPGQISFFNVANAIQAAANYPSQDFFDICYKDVLNPDDAEAQLTYISNLQFDSKRGYKQAFRIGMVHVIRLLLLPVVNYDKNGTEWARSFDIDAFRNEYRLAFTTFKDAGEIGKNISSQIAKVGKRIDRDMNGNFSNEEILQFLSQKLKNL